MKQSKEKKNFDSLKHPVVVIIGGGFAGLTLVKKLRNKPFKVYLIDKHNYHTFQPLLYQVATGSLTPDAIGYPFRRRISSLPNVAFRMGEVTEIDTQNNKVHFNDTELAFDHLIIASGSKTNFFGNKQIEDWAMQLKSMSQALDIRSDFLEEFERSVYLQDENKARQVLNFVVVGGGPTGVEVSGAMAEIKMNILKKDYKEVDNALMQIYLVQSGNRLLPGFSDKSGVKAKKYLEEMGVKVLLNSRVSNYDGHILSFSNGETMATDTVIWSAGVKGAIIPGLPETSIAGNRILVNQFNQVAGCKNIYAVGDVACMQSEFHPRGHPMVAPAAIQQAENLFHNLMLPDSKNWKPFAYKDKGCMATIGKNKAVVDVGKIHLGGFLAWWVWMAVHLMSLVGFKNRVVAIFNWGMKHITFRNAIMLIINPYVRKSGHQETS